jgi:HlyD family secretion protein
MVKEGSRQEEIDAAKQQVKQADAGIDAAQQTLQLAKDGRMMVDIRKKDAEAANQKVAVTAGVVREVTAYQKQTRIISPINGRVSQRMSQAGEIVAPGYAIMTITRTDKYWVTVYIDESKFTGHKVGETVHVEIPVLQQTIPGKITKLMPAADFATKRATNEKGTFDTRSLQLQISLSGDISNLASGITARVHFN